MKRLKRQNACADCAMTPVAECPMSTTIAVNGTTYDVTLLGPTNNGLTWTYQVDKTAGQDLSHFSIQICGDIDPADIVWEIRALVEGECGELLASGTGPNRNFVFQAAGTGNPNDCLTAANVPYIKFDNLADFEEDTEDFCFTFTLPICLEVECICVGATTAGNSTCACIQGPSSTCVPCPDQPVLALDKECPEGIFRPGDTVTINIPVSNIGTADALNVIVTDVINVPAGITIDNIMTTPPATVVPPMGPYTNQDITITWNLGTIAAGDAVLLTVTFDITEVTMDGVITNVETTATADNLEDPVTAGPCTINVVPPGRGIKF